MLVLMMMMVVVVVGCPVSKFKSATTAATISNCFRAFHRHLRRLNSKAKPAISRSNSFPFPVSCNSVETVCKNKMKSLVNPFHAVRAAKRSLTHLLGGFPLDSDFECSGEQLLLKGNSGTNQE